MPSTPQLAQAMVTVGAAEDLCVCVFHMSELKELPFKTLFNQRVLTGFLTGDHWKGQALEKIKGKYSVILLACNYLKLLSIEIVAYICLH